MFNVASDIHFFSKQGMRNRLRGNARFKDLHRNERCFILGTGPSLNGLGRRYIAALENETIFGVNSLYKSTIVQNVVPKYYVLMDNNYWTESTDTFLEVRRNYYDNPPVFITDIRASNFIPVEAEPILLYAKNYPLSRTRYDLTKSISIAMNVVGFSIITAMYMGFKDIYLLGCDYNSFCSPTGSHCYVDSEEYKQLKKNNLSFYLKYYHITTECHYSISKTAKQDKINIINLTEGSLLDAYPKQRISDIFKID